MEDDVIEVELNQYVATKIMEFEPVDLLKQRLPLRRVGLKKASITSSKNSKIQIIVNCEDKFDEFETNLPRVQDLKTAQCPFQKDPTLRNESTTNTAFQANVLDPIQELFNEAFVIQEKERLTCGTPDFRLLYDKKPFLAIEGKQWNSFIKINLAGSTTAQEVINALDADPCRKEFLRAKCFPRKKHSDDEPTPHHKFRMGLKQLRGYLEELQSEIAYGILTTYCHTYLVILDRTAAESKLKISPVVKYSDENVLERIAKFIYLAMKAERKYKQGVVTVSPTKADAYGDDKETGGNDKSRRDRKRRNRNADNDEGNCSNDTKRPGRRRRRNRKIVKQQNPYGQYVLGNILGDGRSGCVVRITNENGQSFAAKCAAEKVKEIKEILAELQQEEMIYEKLKSLQGKVVPMFHCSCYLNDSMYTLMLDELHAVPIWKLDLSKEEKDLIVDALESIHRMGVLHGDLRKSNIMLDRRSNSAYFVDFAFSTECKSQEELKNETIQLKILLNMDVKGIEQTCTCCRTLY